MKINRSMVAALILVIAFSLSGFSQNGESKSTGVGVLLLAHGGSKSWNEEVLKLAGEVNKEMPVEVAFGMASRRTMQEGIDKLSARGVKQIVAVPLFVSSHSSVITSTAYLLGQRSDAPKDLANFAKMDHSHDMSGGSMAPNPDGMIPVKSPVPLRMATALDRNPLVAQILLARARAISRDPAHEVVILVAHGPTPEDDNARWLADMKALAELMKPDGKFARIEYQTVRDDAPDSIRSQATAELRSRVAAATSEDKRVLIVPLLLSYGGIEQGIRKRLEGLDYSISERGLLPDERLGVWIKTSANSTLH